MRLSKHHLELENGEGKCSVPMWRGGIPAGFCDKPAYGEQEAGQDRYKGYCGGLACYGHGGPKGKKI